MTKMITLAATVLLGSASLALAQSALPQYDGDGNQIRASQHSVIQAPTGFENAFAATGVVVRQSAQELDSDGNPIPGAR
jgi:hypothetical protein